ncbi:hypothetical protein KSS87_018707 [Heliosperma pusillum]|nr:hypothetical protein KSS87_018707 [Heliosperma pusillum]
MKVNELWMLEPPLLLPYTKTLTTAPNYCSYPIWQVNVIHS